MTAPDKNRALADALREALGSACLGVTVALGEAEMLVPRPRLFEAMQKLRDDPALAMNQLIDVCAVDEPAEAERFIVVYHLLSLKHNWRLRIVLRTDETTPVASIVSLYPTAGWFEREAFDLFGIVFEGHPDLRRLLTDYDFEGYPLRRDFPLSGFVQLRYDDLNRKVVQEPVALDQDFRPMDSQSPWRGMTDVQRRGGA